MTLQSGISPVVNGSLTLTSGTLAAGGDTLTVDGNWTNNDATSAFSGGTGTVDLGGTSTIGGTSATTFNDVTIDRRQRQHGNVGKQRDDRRHCQRDERNTRRCWICADGNGLDQRSRGVTFTASTGTQTFSGGLTVSGGTFTGSSGAVDTTNFTISSGTFTSPAAFYVTGNFTNNGGTYTGSVEMDGTSAQTIEGSVATTFVNLEIDNSAGVTNDASGTMINDQELELVVGTLALTDSLIDVQ